MRALHLFFQLHQPYSLKTPEGGEHEYFGGGADFREAERKYYQSFFALLERNTQRYAGLKVSLLVSGSWLDQAELYAPELVRRLQKLVDLKQVELVATPYYYSLSAFYNEEEFREQVELSRQKFEGKFSTKLQVLATPGLMYHDRLARWASAAGFVGALAGDAAGVLDFRSSNRVYDAAGVSDFRVLFENGKISRALARGEDLVMAESLEKAEDFSGSQSEDMDGAEAAASGGLGGVAAGPRKRATAAEFVRGRAGVASTASRGSGKRAPMATKVAGKKMYSAKKLQKELDMACLRGNLVSLCLDARMFGEHREEGVVACFDEFFMNWLKVPGNKFLTASEILTAGNSAVGGEGAGSSALATLVPTAEISVKSTVRTSGMLDGFRDSAGRSGVVDDAGLPDSMAGGRGGLARIEEVQFILPEGFRTEEGDKLYGLRERVLKTKNEDLKTDFRKLTVMDYEFGKFREDFAKVLEDFEERVDELLLKPKQLRAENAGEAGGDAGEANLTASRTAEELAGVTGSRNMGVTGEEELEPEDDYTVKVHRILKKADEREAAARSLRGARALPGEELEDFVGDEADIDGAEVDIEFGSDDGLEGDCEEGGAGIEEDSDDFEEDEDGAEIDEAQEMMDAFDAAEAEVQVIAQRMKRSRETAEREFEALMEAEVVIPADEEPRRAPRGSLHGASHGASREALNGDTRGVSRVGTKKKKVHRKIVLD